MLTPAFAGELFGPGQPLDAKRYYIVLPDSLGHGRSTKPSDGLGQKFPRYNYDDMVDAAHRLLTEGLKVRHARLVIGNSMGGMQTWIWAQKNPGFMDVAVPMASLPTEMASRNLILRRMLVDSIRRDPKNAQFASVFFGFATNGGNQALYKAAPTREKAEALLESRLKAPFTADPDDTLYQWDSSRDYNPSGGLEKITATLLAINSADDERNPPETGVLDREIKRVKNGRVLLIPGSPDTAGHGTTASAKWWKKDLEELLRSAPRAPH
jgi:homoserine O-acetyltransferase